MNCVLCRNGATHPGKVTVTLERENTVVVVRDVPAEVCENCGEYDLEAPVAERVYRQGEAAVERRAEVEILRYAA